MKDAIILKGDFYNKISFCLLTLFLILLPFDMFYSELILVCFLLHTLIHIKKEDWQQLKRKEPWIISSVFFISLLCATYSSNKAEALNIISRQLAILLFPVLLFLNRTNLQIYAQRLLAAFVLSCTAVISYLFWIAAGTIIYSHLPLQSVFSTAFTNHNFAAPIHIHATYLSLYIATALMISIMHLLKAKRIAAKWWFIVCCIILLAGLIQLESRAVLIAFLLMISFALPFAFTGKQRILFLFFSILFAAITVLCIYTFQNYRKRFFNDLETDLSITSHLIPSTDSRMDRWEVALALIKLKPWLGYGTGEEKRILKERYLQKKLYSAYFNNLNAHNQYISFLLTGGLPALISYLLTLAYGLRAAIRSKNLLFISFIILILTVSASENFLDRNKGIFFYSFFFSFFICLTRPKENSLQKTKIYKAMRQPSF